MSSSYLTADARVLETAIGPVVVRGDFSGQWGAEKIAALETLAKDHALWLRFWDVGVNRIELELMVRPKEPA